MPAARGGVKRVTWIAGGGGQAFELSAFGCQLSAISALRWVSRDRDPEMGSAAEDGLPPIAEITGVIAPFRPRGGKTNLRNPRPGPSLGDPDDVRRPRTLQVKIPAVENHSQLLAGSTLACFGYGI